MIKFVYSFMTLLLLLIGGLELFYGIKLMQQAKARGERLRWIKQPLLVLALACACLAASTLERLLTSNWIILFLLVVLALGLVIYAIVLIFQQRKRTTDMSNR